MQEEKFVAPQAKMGRIGPEQYRHKVILRHRTPRKSRVLPGRENKPLFKGGLEAYTPPERESLQGTRRRAGGAEFATGIDGRGATGKLRGEKIAHKDKRETLSAAEKEEIFKKRGIEKQRGRT